jgi:predicted nucleic-acid-binding protein
MAARATALLASSQRLLLADLILAECVYVLESFYEVERSRIAMLMRSALALASIEAVDPGLLLRALEVYETDRVDFAEAYLVAQVEASSVGEVVSFDRSIDRIASVKRREP